VLVVDVLISKDLLLVLAELVGKRVTWETCDCGLGVGDDNTALDVESLDFAQGSGISTSVGDELGDDREHGVGVHCLSWTVELFVSLTVGVEITSIRIGNTDVSVWRVSASASIAKAHGLALWVGRVRSQSSGDRVGFPDIHLSTARTMSTISTICAVRSGFPSLNVGLAVNELEITWALSITVSSTILGTGLVAGVERSTTILGHADEVKSTVQATRKMRHIDIECELLVQETEHLVVGVIGHEEHAGSDVSVCTLGDKVESQGIASGGSSICSGVVSTIELAVCCASSVGRAECWVPGIASVAVGTSGRVQPTPVMIEDDLASNGRARTIGGTCLPCKGRVNFRSQSTDLLSGSNRE